MIYIIYNENTGEVNEMGYSEKWMIPSGAKYLEISDEEWTNALCKIKKVENGKFVYSDPPPPPVTIEDYDKVMENHLKEERVARGYTLREPSDYKDDPNPRFAQDAIDWINHRSEVMVYGLNVQNTYKETGEAPSLEEFKENLPKITWTIQD